MQIAAGSLFLAFAVFLNFVELISSELRNLEDLFPGYNGIMPQIKELMVEDQFPNFKTFRNITWKHLAASVLRRKHIIFGYNWGGSYIKEPCRLFPQLKNVFIIFNIKTKEWVTVSRDLSRKLGVGREYELVLARDEVAATHVTTSNNPLYKEAHIRACKQANDRVDIVEQEQEYLLRTHQITTKSSIKVIKDEYSLTYNRVFMLHVHPDGEHNIHGSSSERREELIRPEPSKLEDLFPRYNGIMPRIEELKVKHQFKNFKTFGNITSNHVWVRVLRRDHIIFGYNWEAGYIKELCRLFPGIKNVFSVFDMNTDKWVIVARDLSRKLGAGREYAFVVARDEVAATHVTTSNNPLYKEAHTAACREANDHVDIVELEQEHLLRNRQATIRSSIGVIKNEYSQAYNRAFMLHLHPHGEYNIHGFRERHP